ncbi:MAG: hypothetical protein HC904_15530 [Blastochloris sp.]|nr:hypothetical protein [Blastochloris sp.]
MNEPKDDQKKTYEQDDEPLPYPLVRVWCGISSIGWNLFLVWAAWVAVVAGWVTLPAPGQLSIFGVTALYFLVLALLNFPLDRYCGFVLEKKYGRFVGGAGEWLRQWGQGQIRILWIQILGAYLMASWLMGQSFGAWAVILIPLLLFSLKYWHFNLVPAACAVLTP